MPLSRKFFKGIGFQEYPHKTVDSGLFLDIGRNRLITVGSVGTPNEMLWICQKDSDTKITDLVCLHNYDYDGFLTNEKVYSLLSFFATSIQKNEK